MKNRLFEPLSLTRRLVPGSIVALLALGITTLGFGSELTRAETRTNTDFAVFGQGGLRGNTAGSIAVNGVTGRVTQAILLWHGPTASGNSGNSTLTFNGTALIGTSLGVSSDNGWGPTYTESRAYRADVTAQVQQNGSYTLANVPTLTGSAFNGASLLVFFDDGIASNNRDIVVFLGNDSNSNNAFDANNWNATLGGINYSGGLATLRLVVSDGQTPPDNGFAINGVTVIPNGANFSGNSVPNSPGSVFPGGAPVNGGLWDQTSHDISARLSTGQNTLVLTSQLGTGDLLSLIAAVFELPLGAVPVTNVVTPAPSPLRYHPNGAAATVRSIQITTNNPVSCRINTTATAAFSLLPPTVAITPTAGNSQTLTYFLNNCIPQAAETTAEIECQETGVAQPYRWPLTCPAIQLSSIIPDRRLCRVEEVPAGLQFGIGGDFNQSAGGPLSLDGRYVLFTRDDPNNTRIDPRFDTRVQEVVALDRTTRQIIPITQNSEQTYNIASWRTNGSLVLQSRAFAFFQNINGQQVEQIDGRDLPRLTVSGFPNITLSSSPARISAANEAAIDSADGTTTLVYNGAFQGNSTEMSKLQITNNATGEATNLSEQIRNAAGLPNALSTSDIFGIDLSLNGDGQKVAFSSTIILLGSNRGLRFRNLPGLRVSNQLYIFDRANQTLFEPAFANRGLSAPVTSSFINTRRLGRTGTVVSLDRSLPLVGTPGNVDGTSEVYVADLAGSITQITNSGAGPANERFNSGLAFITFNENAVLFQSYEDLAGSNPDKERQLFRYDIDSKQIRQVSANRGNFATVSRQLNLDVDADFDGDPTNDRFGLGFVSQTIAYGQSADGRVLLATNLGQSTSIANAAGIQIGRRNSVPPTLYVCD